MTRSLAPLDRAGKLNGAAEQQQLFSQGCLAGIGMGNNREGATPDSFLIQTAHNNRGAGIREKSCILPEIAPRISRVHMQFFR